MSKTTSASDYLQNLVWIGTILYAIYFFASCAYSVRLIAIQEFGPVIHEFDPYFNYRATEYLYEHGWKKFVTWFDYKVWYPLGRPVGTTIYPGMQVTAVFLKNWLIGNRMSLNDICCYLPPWFGVSASMFTGLLAYECSLPQNCKGTILSVILDIFRSKKSKKKSPSPSSFSITPAAEIGVFTMAIMAIVPAHLMRSIGGGYDNESVAVTAMTMTFFLWVRSLRADSGTSYLFGALAGIAYFYMAATWGGYVFVLNMVGAHAALLVLLGRFSDKAYKSYTLFYVIGTFLATRVPVIGMTPLKSLEQLAPCAVFLGYQVLQYCEVQRKKKGLSRGQAWKLRVRVFTVCLIAVSLFIYLLAPKGYFGPISARVRGLFVKHTRTGNPLVDSVAEHQPASSKAYFQYLHYLSVIAPIGFFIIMFHFGDAASFLLLYGLVAYFFSAKMVRLILLLAPIASACGGIFLGRIFVWCMHQWVPFIMGTEGEGEQTNKKKKEEEPTKKDEKKKDKSKTATPKKTSPFSELGNSINKVSNSTEGKIMKKIAAIAFLLFMGVTGRMFVDYSYQMAHALSNPTIIIKGTLRSGETVLVDDYREAYFWLKKNTPEDARVLAWWDYGYQITGIANRTTIADGNTWNHEHIALLGRILTGPLDEGYEIARHLADYVLLWTGGGGDDLAKSPHLARIANSVFRQMCPDDPTCRMFGFVDKFGTPSPMMSRSLLYRLHSNEIKPGVDADATKFREVYRTKFGKVRIYKILGVSKESKAWVANPKNRKCDVPGSWFCPGQYPPALEPYLKQKKDFAQLEDFNRAEADHDYQKKYHENLADPNKAKKAARERERKQQKVSSSTPEDTTPPKPQRVTRAQLKKRIAAWREETDQDVIDELYEQRDDTPQTTMMWKAINENAIQDLINWLAADPIVAYIRSSDGRGPMWWAYENGNMEIVELLKSIGLSDKDRDKYGKRPKDLSKF